MALIYTEMKTILKKSIPLVVKTKNYKFGKKKPVLKCEKYLKEHFWKDYIINKWIYEYDVSSENYIYYKHLFINSRVIQICYSGIDICWDGVYVLYECEIKHLGEDFDIFPTDYKLLFGSFEVVDYISRLYKEQYITDEEVEIFSNPKKLNEFRKTLKEIKSL